MQVENFKVTNGPTVKDLPYGETCTFPKYGNNMICMRVQTNQENVKIVVKGSNTKKCKMMNIKDGFFHLVDPWEPIIPVKVKASIIG